MIFVEGVKEARGEGEEVRWMGKLGPKLREGFMRLSMKQLVTIRVC